MKLIVLVSTLDDGILRVPAVLRPTETGVLYVVSWQQSGHRADDDGAYADVVDALCAREDVTLTRMEGRGLCRNRNHAMEVAMSQLDDELEEAVFILADDDERIADGAFDRVRGCYGRYPKLDVALWQMTDCEAQTQKRYPSVMTDYRLSPRYYYPSSVEMTFRSRVFVMGLRFDERFGLGSPALSSGEEEVFLTDALRRGLRVYFVPGVLCSTPMSTTGSHVLDEKVLRSKGAVFGYQHTLFRAFFRTLREALSLGFRRRVNPFRIFSQIWSGVNYIRS